VEAADVSGFPLLPVKGRTRGPAPTLDPVGASPSFFILRHRLGPQRRSNRASLLSALH
jgi:hypothetical protein